MPFLEHERRIWKLARAEMTRVRYSGIRPPEACFPRSLLGRNGRDQERGQDKQAPESQEEHIGLFPEQEQGNQLPPGES